MIQVKKVSYINYLDANNLYGLSMIEKLPYRSLKWDDKITEDDIINFDNGRTGFLLPFPHGPFFESGDASSESVRVWRAGYTAQF